MQSMLDGELHSFTAEHIFSQYDVDPGRDVPSTFIPENDTHAGVFLGNCKCLFILESMVMPEHKSISGLVIQMLHKLYSLIYMATAFQYSIHPGFFVLWTVH